MITRVKIKNFRSLADVDVTLGPLTALVGRNGAGKSAFVDVLRFVRDALRLGLDTAIMQRGGIASLRRWMPHSKPDVEISLTAETLNFWGEYSFVLRSEQENEVHVKREFCRAGTSPFLIQDEFEIRDGKWQTPLRGYPASDVESTSLVLPALSSLSQDLRLLYSHLVDTSVYSIFPNSLREPQKPSNESRLTDDGGNLASILRQMKRRHHFFPEVLAVLKCVVEDVSEVRVRQVGGYLVVELKHEVQEGDGPWFELAQESDGTLRALGLLTALYQDAPPGLTHRPLSIEEPELTFYPGALGALSDVLREAALRWQILITTQSPDLISRFSVDELRVVERINGITQIGPVDEVQCKVLNEQLFSAGDLLRIEDLHRAIEEPVEAKSA